jgi:beta-ureidopropionase / N-carbamoyl-L-amino-acid hydrolase
VGETVAKSGGAKRTAPARPRADRILADLDGLRAERLAFSENDALGRAHVGMLMAELGMDAEIDGLLNVFGTYRGSQPGLRPILVGSHLDTVPNPGRFDGALGVLAGVECCRALVGSGERLRHPLLVVAFSDEEGTMSAGCLGARGCLGLLTAGERVALAKTSHGLGGELFRARTQLAGALGRDIPLNANGYGPSQTSFTQAAAYLELHIEQAPRLEQQGVPVGAVTSIVGIRRYLVRVPGTAGHGGTLPMDARDDALLKACRLAEKILRRLTAAPALGNIGDIRVLPGEFNVIPSEAVLSVEMRAPKVQVLDRLEGALRSDAEETGASVSLVAADPPVRMNARLRRTVRRAAERLSVPAVDLTSWAGHDAAVIAPHLPTAMIFVPSENGHSHSPLEHTSSSDIQAGLDVLLETVRLVDEALDAT